MRRTIQLVLVFVTGFGEFALFITKLVLSVRVLSLVLLALKLRFVTVILMCVVPTSVFSVTYVVSSV